MNLKVVMAIFPRNDIFFETPCIYDYLFHNTLHDISYKNTVMKDNNINDITNDYKNKNDNRE